jgi:hypothetical protein
MFTLDHDTTPGQILSKTYKQKKRRGKEGVRRAEGEEKRRESLIAFIIYLFKWGTTLSYSPFVLLFNIKPYLKNYKTISHVGCQVGYVSSYVQTVNPHYKCSLFSGSF